VEGLGVNASFWAGKRVFLTGHTGFKGSWLSVWLSELGAEVHGYALDPPTTPSLFDAARIAQRVASTIADVRDFERVAAALAAARPDIVIHMAAQPLVRYSYRDPIGTYATNVMGSVHVLEAARRAGTVRAIVNVTTDKCYENRNWPWGYRETEPMGGHDPYSSSKGCAELVTAAYRASFCAKEGIALASARAGNVIGGGDWADDRLVPDILRAFEKHEPVRIRNPHATRPWQHVLEPLSGYLLLAQRLYEQGATFAEGWNFGPVDSDARPVQWIVERLAALWGDAAGWSVDGGDHPHEAHMLKLDISKARLQLAWAPRWPLPVALEKIVHWHRHWLTDGDARQACLRQIHEFEATVQG
jgi:CDP-glucose 4,6-dehydratase